MIIGEIVIIALVIAIALTLRFIRADLMLMKRY